MPQPQRILILQPAFLGDVVLALPIAQQLKAHFPEWEIHFLVRKGNEGLLANHPAVQQVWVWDKQHKYRSLLQLIRALRRLHFQLVVNPHRFFTSGLITALLHASQRIGFSKNPLSLFYNQRYPHTLGMDAFGSTPHEVVRNLSLIHRITGGGFERPRLYPSPLDYATASALAGNAPYVVVAPVSVWFTKQWPAAQWIAALQLLPPGTQALLVGAAGDAPFCEQIAGALPQAQNLAGRLSLLQTAALMAGAQRVYTNDSAPLHLASAMNAPVTAVFCSTVPSFGFGPLSNDSQVAQVSYPLYCRPCTNHGRKTCPEGHFKCAWDIAPASVVSLS